MRAIIALLLMCSAVLHAQELTSTPCGCGDGGGGLTDATLPWSRSWWLATASVGGARIGFGDGLNTGTSEPTETVIGQIANAQFLGTASAANFVTTTEMLPSWQGGLSSVDFKIQGSTDGTASTGDVFFQLEIGCYAAGDTFAGTPPATTTTSISFDLNAAGNNEVFVSSSTGVDISSVCAAGEEIWVEWLRDSDHANDDYEDQFGVTTVTIEINP